MKDLIRLFFLIGVTVGYGIGNFIVPKLNIWPMIIGYFIAVAISVSIYELCKAAGCWYLKSKYPKLFIE